MFYHQEILNRKGQFGIIWMEAMQVSRFKVTKRQVMEVNVRQSCCDILEFVFARRMDRRGKRKSISLYLSSNLMYGTVRIWEKQVNFLIDHLYEILTRLGHVDRSAKENIDIRDPISAENVTMADPMKKRVVDEDPTFGLFKHFPEWTEGNRVTGELDLPPASMSPSVSQTSQRSQDEELSSRDLRPFQAEMDSPHTVSSREKITLRELPVITSPYTEIPIPGEVDLPALTGEELQLMSPQREEVEEVVITMEDLLPLRRISEYPDGLTPDKPPEKPTERAKGEKKRKRQEKEKEQENISRIEQPPPERRPMMQDASFELVPVEVGPRRRRVHRQLVVDASTQLTQVEMKHRIVTSENICRQFNNRCGDTGVGEYTTENPHSPLFSKDIFLHPCPVLTKVVPTLLPSATDLLKRPGSKYNFEHPPIKRLWKRHCKEGLHDTDSDQDERYWTIPEPRRTRAQFSRVRRTLDYDAEASSSQDEGRREAGVNGDQPPSDQSMAVDQTGDNQLPSEHQFAEEEMQATRAAEVSPPDQRPSLTDMPSMEKRLAGSLSDAGTPQHPSLVLSAGMSPLTRRTSSRSRSGLERSRVESDAERDTSRSIEISIRSLEDPLGPVTASSTLGVLPEVVEELNSPPPDLRDFPLDDVFLGVCETAVTEHGKWTTFRGVCPTTNARPYAARCFYTLLTSCAERKLFVRQPRPYGDIYISTSGNDLPRSPV